MNILEFLFPPRRAAELNTDDAIRDRLDDLDGDELLLVRLSVERLAAGRTTYGQLRLAGDRRDFDREALEEAIDLAHYIGALMLRGGPRP